MKEELNTVHQPDQEKIKDFRRFFRKIHNTIRDRDKLDPGAAFDELSKVLFLKAAEDESTTGLPSRPVLTPEQIKLWQDLSTVAARDFINDWFEKRTSKSFKNVFGDHPQISLTPGTMAEVLDMMVGFHVRGGDVDVKGRAFEEFLPSQLRGKGLGQFFTPRPVVNFMVSLAQLTIYDVVADFACGSGGFLIGAFEQMQSAIDQIPPGMLQRLGESRDSLMGQVKQNQLFGIDAEPRAARTAKMNMLMWGDGDRVVRGNSLDVVDANGEAYDLTDYDEDNPLSGCTVILANPPFGSVEKDPAILARYSLGSKDRKRQSEKTEILFIEKGLRLLRPEGKMLIVLPQGILSAKDYARVLSYIHSEAEVRAVVSLPTHTFVQSGVPTVNTCVLYLQKFTTAKKQLYDSKARNLSPENIHKLLRSDPDFDYPIFMATAEFVGYEPSGRWIGAPDEDTDLDGILKDYFNKENISISEIDLFEFASKHYGEKSFRRKDQMVRGTTKGLKTSFVINFRETEERLDPPFYIFRDRASSILANLQPLGSRIVEQKRRLRLSSEDDLDKEYSFVSVSSDGTVAHDEIVRGEEFSKSYKPKLVGPCEFVYNPMRINIGSIGLTADDLEEAITSPDYVVFKSENINSEYLLHLLRSPFYKMYIDVMATGSIRDRLYFKDLQSIRVPDVDFVEQSSTVKLANEVESVYTDFASKHFIARKDVQRVIAEQILRSKESA